MNTDNDIGWWKANRSSQRCCIISSLSPRGFGMLMVVIALCSFAVGLAFWLMGA